MKTVLLPPKPYISHARPAWLRRALRQAGVPWRAPRGRRRGRPARRPPELSEHPDAPGSCAKGTHRLPPSGRRKPFPAVSGPSACGRLWTCSPFCLAPSAGFGNRLPCADVVEGRKPRGGSHVVKKRLALSKNALLFLHDHGFREPPQELPGLLDVFLRHFRRFRTCSWWSSCTARPGPVRPKRVIAWDDIFTPSGWPPCTSFASY
jgi:hypothetical protein